MLNAFCTLNRDQKAFIFLVIDLILIPTALLFTYAVQSLPTSAFETLYQNLPILPYLLIIAAGLSIWLGLPRIRLRAYERHAICLTAIFCLSLVGATAVLSRLLGANLPSGTHVIFGISYFLFLVASRSLMYQVVTAMYDRARPRRRVLIYGAGATGTQLAVALKAHDDIEPVAFVDDNTSLQGITLMGLPVFPSTHIAEIVKERSVDRVLLAMPSSSLPKQAQIVQKVQSLGVDVQALPSFAQLIGEEALVDKLAPVAPHYFLGRASHDAALHGACNSYCDRVILVSGAGGSIGSELCRQLLACRPAKLVLYELTELALYTVNLELCQLAQDMEIEIVPILGSIADERMVRTVLGDHGVQVVLHAAAYKHVPLVEANPLSGLSNNVLGTHTLAREAAEFGVERFILISSDKAVRPTNVMGASKRLAELVVQDLATRYTNTVFTMVRFGNVLGSSGSVVPLFQEQISRGGPVTVTNAHVARYFMTISEAVQLVLKAGDEARGSEVFVLDMGKPVPIMKLARQVIESAGYSVREKNSSKGDIEIRLIGLRPGEKIEEELTLSNELIGTRYPKIFCAREDFLSEIEVASVLHGLRSALSASDDGAALKVVRRWVEGYHSNNFGHEIPKGQAV